MLFGVVGGLLPDRGAAQTVRGTLSEVGTGSPVEGALVILRDSVGQEVDGYLTNAAGRFILRASRGGVFMVTAERIGFETVRSDSFTLATSQILGLPLETSQAPVPLDELRVEGEQRCVVRPEEGLELANLWDEARQVLTVQDWTEREGLYQYLMSSYVRDLDSDAHLVLSETRERYERVTRVPIRSLPAEDLLEGGFVRQLEDGSYEYYGPDASVLLSDEFLDTHCFKLTEGERSRAEIGLSFEPALQGGAPDITGTLWLDRRTAELKTLDFNYTWAPYPEAQGAAGGRIEFEGLPNGAWIVRRWWIRMPTVSHSRNPLAGMVTEQWVSGYTEAGGEVAQAYALNRRLLDEAPGGILAGSVWDGTRAAPLPGAMVYLSGTTFSTETDSVGRFLLPDLPAGTFVAAFDHPRLDSVGIHPFGKEVLIVPGESREVRLSVPSMETILAASCSEGDEVQRPTLALSGRVTRSGTGEPIPGATVTVRWTEDDLAPNAPQASRSEGTDLDGYYVVCGLPADRPLTAEASFLDYRGGVQEVETGPDAIGTLDFALGLPPGVLTLRTTTRGLGSSGGTQGVQGRILEPGTENPVQNAEVVLRQRSGEVVVTGLTNERGFFRLSTPEPGFFAFRASALGYGEVGRDSLEIGAGRLTVLQVEMAPEPLGLDPIVVVAESRVFQLEVQGFYNRVQSGFGHFITPEEIDARPPLDMEDLLRHVPGLRFSRSAYGLRILVAKPGLPRGIGRTGDGGLCEPRLYVDGLQVGQGRMANDSTAIGAVPDQVVDVGVVSAVEVHLRATSLRPRPVQLELCRKMPAAQVDGPSSKPTGVFFTPSPCPMIQT